MHLLRVAVLLLVCLFEEAKIERTLSSGHLLMLLFGLGLVGGSLTRPVKRGNMPLRRLIVFLFAVYI